MNFFERLTLIASDPRISAALMILSVTKMILIYLNYRFWSVKWRVVYGKALDTLVLDRNRDSLIWSVWSSDFEQHVDSTDHNFMRLLVSNKLSDSLNRNLDVFDMHRLFLFLWMFLYLFNGLTKSFWSKICVEFTGKDCQCTKAFCWFHGEIL